MTGREVDELISRGREIDRSEKFKDAIALIALGIILGWLFAESL